MAASTRRHYRDWASHVQTFQGVPVSEPEPPVLTRDASGASAPDGTDRLRWALLLAWVLLLGFCIGFTERPAPLHELESAVASGQVHTVRAGPPGVPLTGHGSGLQSVQWRHGLFRHRAEVVMTTKLGDASVPGSGPGDDGTTTRRGRDIATQLQRDSPGLEVVRVPRDFSFGQIYGWYVPQTLALVALLLILLTLTMLIGGPQPRWASRWAWFWLMATPVGTVLFLLLSGPTPGMPTPRSTRPRLRGGWALVLAVVSAGLLPTLWTSG